uniref:Uncharacterized protein n=1 Tax=Pseudo-nitzschia australis TaxID=44445 RepID=A0A7S4EHM7_9STRA
MRSGTTSPTHPARTMDRSELASEPVACVALLRMAVFQRWWHNGAMPYQRAIYASDRRGTQRTARCKGRDKLPHRNHPTTKRKRTEQCDEWMRCDTTRHDTTRIAGTTASSLPKARLWRHGPDRTEWVGSHRVRIPVESCVRAARRHLLPSPDGSQPTPDGGHRFHPRGSEDAPNKPTGNTPVGNDVRVRTTT